MRYLTVYVLSLSTLMLSASAFAYHTSQYFKHFKLSFHASRIRCFSNSEKGTTDLSDRSQTDEGEVIPYMRAEDSEVSRNSKFGINAIGIVRSPYKIRYQTPKQGIHKRTYNF